MSLIGGGRKLISLEGIVVDPSVTLERHLQLPEAPRCRPSVWSSTPRILEISICLSDEELRRLTVRDRYFVLLFTSGHVHVDRPTLMRIEDVVVLLVCDDRLFIPCHLVSVDFTVVLAVVVVVVIVVVIVGEGYTSILFE
jgi:hypothetical protein